jgi:hypothetical protein
LGPIFEMAAMMHLRCMRPAILGISTSEEVYFIRRFSPNAFQ